MRQTAQRGRVRRRAQGQGGFALLLVFAMAAAAVVMLYLEMPRVAFEHQRDKEGLLVERGEQYVRAIQLYVTKMGKYPQSLEDLESTNNLRFLRQRYRDPISGSEEWRLVHIDGMGQFTDSLVHKPANQKKESGPSLLASNIQGIGSEAQYLPQAGERATAATRRTASDRIIPGTPGALGGPAQSESGEPAADNSRSGEASEQPPETTAPAQPGTATPIAGVNGQPSPFQLPGQRPATTSSGYPTQAANTQQGGAAAQQGSQFGFTSGGFGGDVAARPPVPYGGMTGQTSPGQPTFGQSTTRPGAPNQALQAIQQMLTNPRQGTTSGGMGNPLGGTTVGGGIAGVASKSELEGIKVYNEKTNYSEWEFLWDQKKAQQQQAGGTGGMPGTTGQGTGSGSGTGSGQRQGGLSGFSGSSSSGSSFGGSSMGSGSSSGSSSGFGFNSGGFGSSAGSSSGSSSTPKPAPSGPIRP